MTKGEKVTSDIKLSIEDDSRKPKTGTPDVDPATKFSFNFNKKINKSSISKTNVQLLENNNTVIPISEVNVVDENDKSKVTIKTTNDLKPNTQYRIKVGTDVQDIQDKPLGT